MNTIDQLQASAAALMLEVRDMVRDLRKQSNAYRDWTFIADDWEKVFKPLESALADHQALVDSYRQQLRELIAHHDAEAKIYAGRAGVMDNPTAAEWLDAMAKKHAAWSLIVQNFLRESDKGDRFAVASQQANADSRKPNKKEQ